MSVKEIQEMIDAFHYWDARVVQLNCSYFADEIELIYDIEDYHVIYRFIGCYKSFFNHDKGYDKLRPVQNMTVAQMPYFLQKVMVDEEVEKNMQFYTCKIDMYPLDVEIWCKDIKIIREKA